MNVAMVPSCMGLRLFKNCNYKIKIIMYNNVSQLIDGNLSMCTEDNIIKHKESIIVYQWCNIKYNIPFDICVINQY